RPLLVLWSTRECRSLRVTVRTEKAKILLPVVQPVAADVIHVQYYRPAVPLGRDATSLAGVRYAALAQDSAQDMRRCPPWPVGRITCTCSGVIRHALGFPLFGATRLKCDVSMPNCLSLRLIWACVPPDQGICK